MSDKSKDNKENDVNRMATEKALKRGKKGRLTTSSESPNNRRTAKPNYSTRTLERIRKVLDDNRAIVRIAIASTAAIVLATALRHEIIDSTLLFTEKLKEATEEAYYEAFKTKLKAEREKYEQKRESDTVDTITELEMLNRDGYNVSAFNISEKDLEYVFRINSLYITGLYGEPLYTSDRPMEDVVKSVFESKLRRYRKITK